MPAWVFVVGGLVVLVGVLLAVDWLTAGRAKRRMLGRGRDARAAADAANYGVVDEALHNFQHHNPNP
jgi:hypothetical protein